MRFSNEPNIDQLDQPSLVTEIESAKQRIEECQRNHELLDKSTTIFDETAGLFHEMGRLERVMQDERGRIQAALKRLKSMDPTHPLVSEYREEEPAQQAKGWRARLRRLFNFA
jgi:hypothetical protein